MREFDTGATRDSDDSKLDFEGFLSHPVLVRYAQYMHQHRVQADGGLRASDNWQKGIPKDAYMKSAFRHFMDWWMCHRGNGDRVLLEESLCALLFNVMGYLREYLEPFGAPGPKQYAFDGNATMAPGLTSPEQCIEHVAKQEGIEVYPVPDEYKPRDQQAPRAPTYDQAMTAACLEAYERFQRDGYPGYEESNCLESGGDPAAHATINTCHATEFDKYGACTYYARKAGDALRAGDTKAHKMWTEKLRACEKKPVDPSYVMPGTLKALTPYRLQCEECGQVADIRENQEGDLCPYCHPMPPVSELP